MKLRNKRTGEIAEPFGITCINGRTFVQFDDGAGTFKFEARSLAELNEEWEDAPEEPKKHHYYIEPRGQVIELSFGHDIDELKEELSEIGNYFETKEEAEKALEKLKAWKRLKDKGFEIESWDNCIGDDYYKTGQIVLNLNNVKNSEWDEYDQIGEIKNDLDLLFGGEE